MCFPYKDCIENLCAQWQTFTVFDGIFNGFRWEDGGDWHVGPVASEEGKHLLSW